jgi:RNA polymerase sigma factor (sigma-70 family)
MLYFEEKSNEEIAEIVGITQNNVRVKMTRIREKLKTYVTR